MLQNFNSFGEARVKSDSILLTVSALENSQGLTFHNEVDISDISPEINIPESDPVRFIFASLIDSPTKLMTVKRQVAGPTLSAGEESIVDGAIEKIVKQLASKLF